MIDINSLVKDTDSKALIKKVAELANTNFSARASEYDRLGIFPTEDFKDLFQHRLMAPLISKEYGGLGLGHDRGDIHTLWMMTKAIAKANLSLARCWEAHNNALFIIDSIATSNQKKLWCEGIVDRGQIWTVWSGEPQSKTPEQKKKIGTTLTKVDNGFILNGSKVFASSASGAQWAILLVNTETFGGARHATQLRESLLMMACDLSDTSIKIDDSWWNPIGMRASDSLRVEFNNTFIADENILGVPGQFLTDAIQTRFTPHYTASFLGAAEATYDYALEYINTQNKSHDPYIQHRIGKMAVNLETGHLWLQHVANLWEEKTIHEAQIAGVKNRYLMENLVMEIVSDCIKICGARSLMKPSVAERVYRDLAIYIRNDNNDHVLATLGRVILGKDADISFHNI